MLNESAVAFFTASLIYWAIFLAVAFGTTWYLLMVINEYEQEQQSRYEYMKQFPPPVLHPVAAKK